MIDKVYVKDEFEVRVLVYVLYVAGMQSYKVASKSRSVAVTSIKSKSLVYVQEFRVCAECCKMHCNHSYLVEISQKVVTYMWN